MYLCSFVAQNEQGRYMLLSEVIVMLKYSFFVNVNDCKWLFFQTRAGFCILHWDKYHHKWGATKQKQNTERNGQLWSREGFCANLLCNVWQHACMFVVVFHTDNHVLTHSKWRNILHCLQFLLILTKNVAYVSMVCSVFLKKYNGTFLASPELWSQPYWISVKSSW